MASGFLLLLDDIATLLDDVAVLSKVAAKKTAGVLGDDLALNAQQVTGVNADRELPVVWAVAKGSFVNKLILIPTALLISGFAPWAVVPLLMVGGAYLCFEGFEKVLEKTLALFKKNPRRQKPTPQIEVSEDKKIQGAIRTDFILSAEIIIITLGTLTEVDFSQRLLVLCLVSIAMTVGVYGLVATIVKIDDAGLLLLKRPDSFSKKLGAFLVRMAPGLMRAIGIAGTVAMFVVGGGIVSHGWPLLHEFTQEQIEPLGLLAASGFNILVGLAIGGFVFVLIHPLQTWWKSRKKKSA